MRTRLHRETWRAAPPRATVAPALRPWLTDPASLTSRIRARCAQFSVQLLEQRLGRALNDEAALLGLRAGELVWVREVLLLADGRPVVFARTLLPRCNLRGTWNLFHGFGARSLGLALFADPAIRRTALVSTRLDRRDARYHRAQAAQRRSAHPLPAAALPGTLPAELWARRSVFVLRGRALMVSEVFLPAILELPR
jgi:chorismate--pyruvate lyase